MRRYSVRFCVEASSIASSMAAFMLPVSVLLDPRNHVHGRRSIGGEEFEVRDLRFGPHLIWGATAGMLFALYEMGLS